MRNLTSVSDEAEDTYPSQASVCFLNIRFNVCCLYFLFVPCLLSKNKNTGFYIQKITHGVSASFKCLGTLVSLAVGGATSPLTTLSNCVSLYLAAICSASGLILTAGGSSSHLKLIDFHYHPMVNTSCI